MDILAFPIGAIAEIAKPERPTVSMSILMGQCESWGIDPFTLADSYGGGDDCSQYPWPVLMAFRNAATDCFYSRYEKGTVLYYYSDSLHDEFVEEWDLCDPSNEDYAMAHRISVRIADLIYEVWGEDNPINWNGADIL